jgi:hypothetical protein
LAGAVVGGILAYRACGQMFADAGGSQDSGVFAFFGAPVVFIIYMACGAAAGFGAGMLFGTLFSSVRAIQRR